ncbi:MAG: AAA family ATPase, partial [Candidatus Binatia bacterium]
RLAHHTYIGVVGISADHTFTNVDTNGNASEFAVKMNRLPENRMLDSLLSAGSLAKADLAAIAHKLAAFHKNADRAKSALYGSVEAIMDHVAANFRDTRRFIGDSISSSCFAAIEAYSFGFLKDHQHLVGQRSSGGWVCEGHGDLRAEHICLVGDTEIFDCIEFDEALRYSDVASEIGFLSMDLDFLGQPNLSSAFETAYGSSIGDAELATLLPFYKCYRAYVRGKVESLKSSEEDVSESERRRASLKAMQYFCLSERYAKGPPAPKLLMVCGKIGSGKTTVARLLSARTGFAVLSSDVTRKGLLGLHPAQRAISEFRTGAYSEEITEKTYATLWADAEQALAAGDGVIIDATFADRKHRHRFIELANQRQVPALFVECRSDEENIRLRLEEREKDAHEISDANWTIHQRLSAQFAPFDDLSDACHVPIITDEKLANHLEKLEGRL